MKITKVQRRGSDFVFTIERTITEEHTFGSPVSTGEDGEIRDPGLTDEEFVRQCADNLRAQFEASSPEVEDLSHLV